MRQLVREAQRYKVVGRTRGVDSEDAERIRAASDGEIVGVDNPEAIQEKMFGGLDQRNFAFMLQIKQLFSWQAGNLDLMGGLGAQSETATQDQLLHASASQRMAGRLDEVRLVPPSRCGHRAAFNAVRFTTGKNGQAQPDH